MYNEGEKYQICGGDAQCNLQFSVLLDEITSITS